MRKILNLLKKNIVKLLVCLLLLVFTLNNNKDVNKEITYRLNTKSKKVHSLDCGVGKRAKEKNKKLVTDTLKNILYDGYTICGDCNAGYKKSFIESVKNFILGPGEIDYDDLVLPSKEEYLNAIDKVGNWYVNHIPTYCKHLQTEKVGEYVGNDEFVDIIELNTKGKLFSRKKYNYITSSNTDIRIIDISTNSNILKASEKAINNYKNNYERINVFGGILQYPCELMEKNNYYYEAGDDCVRYWFTVLNSIDSNFVYRISNTARKKWSSINTNLIYKNDKNFAEAMIKNGFKIYDSITERNTENVKIEKLTPSFNLEKGDVVCRKGHVQIYIGNNETDNFGWGKVSRNFPANYNFSLTESEVNSLDEVTVNDTNNEKKYIVKMDKGYGTEVYTRVYRYVGGAENEE